MYLHNYEYVYRAGKFRFPVLEDSKILDAFVSSRLRSFFFQ